jgi:hypothetical protein
MCALVQKRFAELGASQKEIAAMSQSQMTDGDEVLARIYRAGEMFALWNSEHNTLRFYNRAAEIVATCDLTGPS